MLPYLFSILILLFPVRSQFLSCPLEGPQFPPPQNLPSDSTVQSALASLQSKLQSLSSSANGTLDPLTSFSIEAFSTQSTSPLFQFHHAGSSVKASSTGIKNITRDSIYRIGSVSKLVTVYLFLIEAGDSYFSQPITKFVPELAAAAAAQNSSSGGVQQGNSNVLDATQWEQITLGALASHMAGIQRDDATADLLVSPAPWPSLGFPTINASSLPSCGFSPQVPPCTRDRELFSFPEKYLHSRELLPVLLRDLIKHPPVVAPFSTPIYSNTAFTLLSYALEAITGRNLSDMMTTDLFSRLDMSHSSFQTPPDTSKGVIPFNTSYSGWDIDLADGAPAGSIFSSPSDLTLLLRSILTSTLLSPTQTRHWLKPHSLTAQPNLVVGAPWEIFRLQPPTDLVRTDLYTKSGDLGRYSSIIVLAPDHGIGFSVLAVDGAQVAATVSMLADAVAGALLPAAQEAAKTQAGASYAGVYSSTNNGTVGPATELEIVLDDESLGPGAFGLRVKRWLSEGRDMFASLLLTQSAAAAAQLDPSAVAVRLVPIGLESPVDGSRAKMVAFRAVFGLAGTPDASDTFSLQCASWTTVDALEYAGRPLDGFLFRVEGGKAVGFGVRALGVEMARVS